MSATPAPRNARSLDEVVTNPVLAAPIGDGPEVGNQASRIDRMREYFAKQPKRQIRIRKELGDQTAQINGYTFLMKAGEKISVPEDVAVLLEDAGII
jgi:hypothetical protein